jgi:hypothetical protein
MSSLLVGLRSNAMGVSFLRWLLHSYDPSDREEWPKHNEAWHQHQFEHPTDPDSRRVRGLKTQGYKKTSECKPDNSIQGNRKYQNFD